ncbi:MAG: hypothetical protein ACYTFM_06365 [Planctomycetota bacterium]
MVEETKKVKKKEGMIKKTIRWIWRIFLVIIILLGLWFRAPVKALIVPVIFLLGCAALPRVYRKWFWAAVGIIIIACIVWVFLPEDKEGWERYKYDFSKELETLEAIHAIPDHENAATIYKKVIEEHYIEDFGPNTLDPNTYYTNTSILWKSDEYPEQSKWLENYEQAIQKLIEGSKLDKCYFPLKEEDFQIFTIKIRRHLFALRHLFKVIVISAGNDLAECREEEGLEKQISLLRITEHMRQQPVQWDMLVGIAVEALTLNQVRNYIINGEPSDYYLNIIEEELGKLKYEWKTEWEKVKDSQILSDIRTLCGITYFENSQGEIITSPIGVLSVFYKNTISSKSLRDNLFIKIERLISWFFIPSNPDKAAEIIRDVIAKRGPELSNYKEPSFKLNFRYFVESSTMPTIKRIYYIFMRLESERKGTLILTSLRRYKDKYGQWPESLEDIETIENKEIFIDPLNGQAFVYRLTEDSFRLYSRGLNKMDDDGFNYRRDSGKEGSDDWQIWPPRR